MLKKRCTQGLILALLGWLAIFGPAVAGPFDRWPVEFYLINKSGNQITGSCGIGQWIQTTEPNKAFSSDTGKQHMGTLYASYTGCSLGQVANTTVKGRCNVKLSGVEEGRNFILSCDKVLEQTKSGKKEFSVLVTVDASGTVERIEGDILD